jgi:hypothetical protein
MHGAAVPQSLTIRLGDRSVSVLIGPSVAAIESAVALLRTVFEDHFADPEYRECLFFHGCTLIDSRREKLDFSVRHQGDRVVLTDWSWAADGPTFSSLPRLQYAQEILAFARQVRAAGMPSRPGPSWLSHYSGGRWLQLGSLCLLTARYLAGGEEAYATCRRAYEERHGHRRRPLELAIEVVIGTFEPWHPVEVLARPVFGPLHQGALLPLMLNGQLIRGIVTEFRPGGVALSLEGVGWGGVAPGDRLVGLQLFHP